MNDVDYRGPVYRSPEEKINPSLTSRTFRKPSLSSSDLDKPAYYNKKGNHDRIKDQDLAAKNDQTSKTEARLKKETFKLKNDHTKPLLKGAMGSISDEKSIPFLMKDKSVNSFSTHPLNQRLQDHVISDNSHRNHYLDSIPPLARNRSKSFLESAHGISSKIVERSKPHIKSQKQISAGEPNRGYPPIEINRELLQRMIKSKDSYILLEVEGTQYDE